MDAQTAYLYMLEEIHRSFRAETRDLTPDQLYYQPDPKANTIIFLPWHWVRTEDGVIHRSLGGTPIWEAGGWQHKFNFPPQGSSGIQPEDVTAFRPELSLVMDYFAAVWQVSVEKIKNATNEDLERQAGRNMNVARNIESVVIGHGFWHLGEVRFIKGLLGMPFVR